MDEENQLQETQDTDAVDMDEAPPPKPRFQRRRSSTFSEIGLDAINSLIKTGETMPDKQRWFTMKDDEMLTVGFIFLAVFVAALCGVAAYLLHVAVYWTGCLGGANGCHKYILLDPLKEVGVTKTTYFLVTTPLSALICALILQLPVAKKCKGGGSAGAKVVISAGQFVSGWVPFLRILLAAVYLGGGNTLGSEGPIIHLSSCLATCILHMLGFESRKMYSMFAVVGAAAGIAAGFGVVVTGVVFVIEELTRSMSPRSALVVTLGTGVATLVRHRLSEFSEQYISMGSHSMVPAATNWAKLTDGDIAVMLLLCLPIGVINGLAGWTFTRCAWQAKLALPKTRLPEWLILPAAGLFSASLGALVYEVTHINGVWGTTSDVVIETIAKGVSWYKVLLCFVGKFFGMTLATAAGGPGGTLVPSLTAGGLVGIMVGRIASCSEHMTAACAILGMGSLFASVMHMPVTGVVIIYELTGATDLVVHVIFANFIASIVMSRLPHGGHSFVHLSLENDPVWVQLGGQDFIETDAQELKALDTVGIRKLLSFQTRAIRYWLMPDAVLLQMTFHGWKDQVSTMSRENRTKLHAFESQRGKYLRLVLGESNESLLRLVFGALIRNNLAGLKTSLDEHRAHRSKSTLNSSLPRAEVKVLGRFRRKVKDTPHLLGCHVGSRRTSKVTPEDLEQSPVEANLPRLPNPSNQIQPSAPPQPPSMLPGSLNS